jgi:hypothetical protein
MEDTCGVGYASIEEGIHRCYLPADHRGDHEYQSVCWTGVIDSEHEYRCMAPLGHPGDHSYVELKHKPPRILGA